MSPSHNDLLLPFTVEASGLRGRLVRLGPALASMLAGHDYPPPVAKLVAEAAVLAVVLAGMLKYDGLFTLQMKGDGPVRFVVVDVTSQGDLRAYARFDAAEVAAIDPRHEPVPGLLGGGHLAFTVDQGPDTERYQGITELTGASLADCAHAYFRRSEQIETAIRIVARLGEDGSAYADAVMVQRLPEGTEDRDAEEAEDAWRQALALVGSLSDKEMADPGLTPEDLLYRLFHEPGVRVFAAKPLRHRCRCSRASIERALRTLAPEELRDIARDGSTTITCEFCRAGYSFEAAELLALTK